MPSTSSPDRVVTLLTVGWYRWRHVGDPLDLIEVAWLDGDGDQNDEVRCVRMRRRDGELEVYDGSVIDPVTERVLLDEIARELRQDRYRTSRALWKAERPLAAMREALEAEQRAVA